MKEDIPESLKKRFRILTFGVAFAITVSLINTAFLIPGLFTFIEEIEAPGVKLELFDEPKDSVITRDGLGTRVSRPVGVIRVYDEDCNATSNDSKEEGKQ